MQAEFEKLKDASRGFVEKELELMGIPHSADMDDMTIKLREFFLLLSTSTARRATTFCSTRCLHD